MIFVAFLRVCLAFSVFDDDLVPDPKGKLTKTKKITKQKFPSFPVTNDQIRSHLRSEVKAETKFFTIT